MGLFKELYGAYRMLGLGRFVLGMILLPFTFVVHLIDDRGHMPSLRKERLWRERALAHRYGPLPGVEAPAWCGDWKRGVLFATVRKVSMAKTSCLCGFLDQVSIRPIFPGRAPDKDTHWDLDPAPSLKEKS